MTIQPGLDPWLSLQALGKHSSLSVRGLRANPADPRRPLPHYRMKAPHLIACKPWKDGKGPRTLTVPGKILVRHSDIDRCMQAFRHAPDLDCLVQEVVRELRQRAAW